MIKDNRQVVVLNEFNSREKFYKMANVEDNVRDIAESYPNAYQVVTFACCREDYYKFKICFPTKEKCEEHYSKIKIDENRKRSLQILDVWCKNVKSVETRSFFLSIMSFFVNPG